MLDAKRGSKIMLKDTRVSHFACEKVVNIFVKCEPARRDVVVLAVDDQVFAQV